MLAAESSWRILDAEHHRLRQLLAEIARALDGDAWRRPGTQLDLLRQLVREFQGFEAETHRPKGVVLMGSMRGRLPQADDLLDELQHERHECERFLGRALTLLDALGRDGAADAGEVASLLQQHRDSMTRQLDREDTVFRAYSARLLTPEEWSAVASSISKQVHRQRGHKG
jgi:hemerythrin-like domain-containing protein